MLDTQVVDLAATFGSAYMRIAGNTDNVGSRDANVRLSRARADAVTQLPGHEGLRPEQVRGGGQRPDKPVASNDTDDGRAKNRRTDFEVVPPLMEVREPVSRGASPRSWPLAGVAAFLGRVVRASATRGLVPSVILPSPTDVLQAFPVLHFEEALVRSAGWPASTA